MRMHNRLMNASIILVGSRKTIYVNAIFFNGMGNFDFKVTGDSQGHL